MLGRIGGHQPADLEPAAIPPSGPPSSSSSLAFMSSSSTDDSSSAGDDISVELGSSEPEVLTETMRKQTETEESVLSLFDKYDSLSEADDFHMYVFHDISILNRCDVTFEPSTVSGIQVLSLPS